MAFKNCLFIFIMLLCFSGNLYPWSETSRGKRNTFYVSPSFFYPIGEYGNFSDPGYGGTILYLRGKTWKSGIEMGGYHLAGAEEDEQEERELKKSDIITANIRTGYTFNIIPSFSITPAVSAGLAYIKLKYFLHDTSSSDEKEYHKNGTDPLVSVSISSDWYFRNGLFIGIETGYGVLLEKEKNFNFVRCGFSTGVRF